MRDGGLSFTSWLEKSIQQSESPKFWQILNQIGVSGNAFKWTAIFLLDKHERIIFKDCYSNWKEVKKGISQGLVLGPVLFILSINPMPPTISSELHLFADVANVFRIIASSENARILQNYLSKLSEWSKKSFFKWAKNCVWITITSKLQEHGVYILDNQVI